MVDDVVRMAIEALQPFASLHDGLKGMSGDMNVLVPGAETRLLRVEDLARAATAVTALRAASEGLRAEVEALRLAYALARGDYADAVNDEQLFGRTEPPLVTLAVMDRAAAAGRLDDLLNLVGDGAAVPLPEVRDRVVELLSAADGSLRVGAARALQRVAPSDVRKLVTAALEREGNRFVKPFLVAVLRASAIPDDDPDGNLAFTVEEHHPK